MKARCFLILTVFFLSGCATVYNPATGRREFIMIPTDQEVAMGKNIHQQITQEMGLSRDAYKLGKLRGIGERLAKVSDRQDFKYNFFLVDKKDLNAFTVPGGNIYFFNGLFDKLQGDDEVASVLAHEIGHCAARHTIKKFQAALGYDLLSSLIFGSVPMGEGVQTAAGIAAGTAMNLAMSAYGRKDEYEADRLGIKYMYLAGYSPDGMIKVLKLLKQESQDRGAPLILRTHPFLEDRIKAVEEEIKVAPLKYGPE